MPSMEPAAQATDIAASNVPLLAPRASIHFPFHDELFPFRRAFFDKRGEAFLSSFGGAGSRAHCGADGELCG